MTSGEGEGAGNADAVERAIAERLAAIQAGDSARADVIRARLMEDGIVLEDGPAGTTWRHARGSWA